MKILLTGHNGYIGSRLLKSLNVYLNDCDIFVWDKNFGDLFDTERFANVLELIKPDIAILCAWQSTRPLDYEFDPRHYNWPRILELQVKILKAKDVFPIVFGSVADTFASVKDAYTQSKIELRRRLKVSIDCMEISYLRPHYVLDEIEERPRIVKGIRAAIEEARDFFPNNPNGFADYIHINDVISAIHLVVFHKIAGMVNISSGVERNAFSIAQIEYFRSGKTYKYMHQAKNRSSDLSRPHPSLISLNWWPEATSQYFSLPTEISE